MNKTIVDINEWEDGFYLINWGKVVEVKNYMGSLYYKENYECAGWIPLPDPSYLLVEKVQQHES